MARILLIDCDPSTIALLPSDLANQRHTIDAATAGEISVESVIASNYDLIVLDPSTAKPPDIQFCHQLRDQSYANPVLLLTLTVGAIVDPADLQPLTTCHQKMIAGQVNTCPTDLRFRHQK